ncbi:hypothetical protein ACHAXR_011656 [Thalassiosira sp. AJA248-18]
MTMTSNGNGDNGAMPPSPTATSATASGCPVLARSGDAESSTTKPGLWNRWFSRSNNESTSLANAPPSRTSISSISECPVKVNKSTPASIEEAANHSQIPAPGQRIHLSTQRVISSIPRGDAEDTAPLSTENNNKPSSIPAHQPTNSHRWQYPSEQQFYNAMLKKGYRPPVDAIPDTLRIHNAVNERSWSQVCKWEKELHDNAEPKLVKFVGRPKDLSPKAWWNSRIFMTEEPFDRHDWYVEDVGGGEPRRYVIDFYEGKESSAFVVPPSTDGEEVNDAARTNKKVPIMKPPSMYIDVRPALDNPSSVADRMTMFVREALPGITGAWDSYKTSSSSSSNDASEMGKRSHAGSGEQ